MPYNFILKRQLQNNKDGRPAKAFDNLPASYSYDTQRMKEEALVKEIEYFIAFLVVVFVGYLIYVIMLVSETPK